MPDKIDISKVTWNNPDSVGALFGSDAETARKIIAAESSGNPNAINKNKNGTHDGGLFQINSVHVPALMKAGIISNEKDLLNPEVNTAAAAYLYHNKGLQPWDASKKNWGEEPIDPKKVKWDNESPQQVFPTGPQRQPAISKQPPPPAPKWGAENPNLYGLYGAGKGVVDALTNIPRSTAGYVKSTIEPLLHPVETAKGMYNLVTLDPKTVDAFKNYYVQKYGSIDRLNETAINDPVGLMGDLSMFLSGAGGALKVAGKAGKVASVAKVGSQIASAGSSFEPINAISGVAVKGATAALPTSVETSMYRRALKPSTTLNTVERDKRINTGLNEGIPSTSGGLGKSKQTIREINSEIQDRINAYSAEGQTVNAGGVANKVENDLLNQIVQKEPLPDRPLTQVSKVTGEFRKNSPSEISLRQAQDYKQSLNKQLDDFYRNLSASPDKSALIAQQWTNKTKAALASSLRDEISNIFPEVTSLNKRESALIQFNKTLERSVNRISQHDLLSLKGLIATVKDPRYFFVNYVLNNPKVESSLAIALRSARTKGFTPGTFTTPARQVLHGLDNIGQDPNQ
jgi:hypothetical protein